MVQADGEDDVDRWEPPAAFDQFAVLEPLGRGGMGHVYLGRDAGLDSSANSTDAGRRPSA